MSLFVTGHATHPDWRVALQLAAAQVDAQAARGAATSSGPPSLGLVYFSDRYAPHAPALLAELQQRWPRLHWAGCAALGVAAGGVEYIDEPALVLMVTTLPEGRFEVFSGARPQSRVQAHTALVHVDPQTPDLSELVAEMADRTGTGYLFGGVVSSRTQAVQVADGIWHGGLSGVAFTQEVALVSRVTQGCQPIGPEREITAAERNLVLELDGRPALNCLLADLGITLQRPREAMPTLRATMVGLSDERPADGRPRHRGFGADVRVRHLIGLDPQREAVAVAEMVEPGMRLSFCHRDVNAARRDLVRICSEIRDELAPEEFEFGPLATPEPSGAPAGPEATLRAPEMPATGSSSNPKRSPPSPRRIEGAIYVSCAGRGGPHFGGPSAELQIVRHALGDVPLVGFFAGGEIARHHLYGYTGVLTVFTSA